MSVLKACVLCLRAVLIPKAKLAAENLILRQQLDWHQREVLTTLMETRLR